MIVKMYKFESNNIHTYNTYFDYFDICIHHMSSLVLNLI